MQPVNRGSPRRQRRSGPTRAALERASRELFAERGFAVVSVEEVARRAGVTTGAIYHHYGDKSALFRHVVDAVEAEMTERVLQRARSEPRLELHLELGCEALLDEFLNPEIRQIVLIDAPAVLGWNGWRALDEHHALGLLEMALAAAIDADYIERQPVRPLAQVLLAALSEAGLQIAHADDVNQAREQIGRIIHRLLDGLKVRA